ncbi:hypothetical protein D5R81_18520 [Parashewanella spongiae]|uniref:Death domain-containing protein n=1 Tax=Parashewanella spongiae TaxID=342950 RepID=A0A3A6TLS4_9GAMM|nr:death domain-containing protein [Parashewanella spongiae]MCL1080022.1 death domain-containing protein [Parashewanella spongiae]RJY05748.1 hypothetical protein D5R81_18520 [Parashewanella spongiae]
MALSTVLQTEPSNSLVEYLKGLGDIEITTKTELYFDSGTGHKFEVLFKCTHCDSPLYRFYKFTDHKCHNFASNDSHKKVFSKEADNKKVPPAIRTTIKTAQNYLEIVIDFYQINQQQNQQQNQQKTIVMTFHELNGTRELTAVLFCHKCNLKTSDLGDFRLKKCTSNTPFTNQAKEINIAQIDIRTLDVAMINIIELFECASEKYQFLGMELGLKSAQIKEVETSILFHNDVSRMTQVLSVWEQCGEQSPTFYQLIAAAENQGENMLAQNLLKLLKSVKL